MLYKADGRPLVILAGKEYGTGSSRDWAAKGTVLLGVRAVIAESFERIHRSNLVGMGVLPLQFRDGENATSLGLDGSEKFSVSGVAELKPRQDVEVVARRQDKSEFTFTARCRIDTYNELEYFRAGGILPYVLRRLASS
jgi:aconitate hydratase